MSNEENLEPTAEEIVEPTETTEEPEFDPDAKVMSPREMSYLLTNQTFAFCASVGQGLKDRYDQLTIGVPPKAKNSQFNKGYIQALNDVASGLMQYQQQITERAVADGIMSAEEAEQFLPKLPEQEATATDSVESSE